MRFRTLLTATFALLLLNSTFGQKGLQNPAQPSKPFTLAQIWTFDATYTDQQHGVTFRYPSVSEPTTQFGYHPPALTLSDEKPIAGFGYSEGPFPRDRVVGPYSATNLEGFGVVYSAVPMVRAAECEARTSSVCGYDTVQFRNALRHLRPPCLLSLRDGCSVWMGRVGYFPGSYSSAATDY